MSMYRNSTIFLHYEERGLYFVAVRNAFLQVYVTSTMGIVHDYFIEKIEDEFTDSRLLWSSVVPDSFQCFCDREECENRGTDSFRDTGTDSLRDGSSDRSNRFEVVGSSSPYKISA